MLQRIAAQAKTVKGEPVAPVAWDCNCLEEVCGACTMVINGRVRQSCSALVDKLLADRTGIIIAHRLATVTRADDVLILDGGRVVEFGERAALAADPGSRFSTFLRVGLEEMLA